MSPRSLILLATGSIVAAFCVIAVVVVISTANYGNRTEVQLDRLYTNNQNILGQYTLKVQEAASVPAMYRDDLQKVMVGVMNARMGPDGSKAMFQWFQEQNIPFDSSLYAKVQQIVEAGRNEFQTSQTRLIDAKAGYQIALGSIPQGLILGALGYPRVDLTKYKPIVASDTQRSFDTGVQAPIKLR